uniref:Uncharacterized protein n=1 Tax=Anguilla anguilla TaxID=7936 RepID=A0A0E9UZ78_ANGAN
MVDIEMSDFTVILRGRLP